MLVRDEFEAIETVDGGAVLVPPWPEAQRVSAAQRMAYIRALVAEAQPRNGWLWCSYPSPELVAVVRATWAIISPGWATDDADVAGMVTHSGIAHHLAMVGARIFSAQDYAAYRILQERSDIANRKVTGYLRYGQLPSVITIRELLLSDAGMLAKTQQQLDGDAYDEDIVRLESVVVQGAHVSALIERLARQPAVST